MLCPLGTLLEPCSELGPGPIRGLPSAADRWFICPLLLAEQLKRSLAGLPGPLLELVCEECLLPLGAEWLPEAGAAGAGAPGSGASMGLACLAASPGRCAALPSQGWGSACFSTASSLEGACSRPLLLRARMPRRAPAEPTDQPLWAA